MLGTRLPAEGGEAAQAVTSGTAEGGLAGSDRELVVDPEAASVCRGICKAVAVDGRGDGWRDTCTGRALGRAGSRKGDRHRADER